MGRRGGSAGVGCRKWPTKWGAMVLHHQTAPGAAQSAVITACSHHHPGNNCNRPPDHWLACGGGSPSHRPNPCCCNATTATGLTGFPGSTGVMCKRCGPPGWGSPPGPPGRNWATWHRVHCSPWWPSPTTLTNWESGSGEVAGCRPLGPPVVRHVLPTG